jgi:hypothetical protein
VSFVEGVKLAEPPIADSVGSGVTDEEHCGAYAISDGDLVAHE